MLAELTNYIVLTVAQWGYLGIFTTMVIESSFIPFPSEVILIPAGYLVYQGEMEFAGVFLSGLLGSMLGAFINYYLAFFVGRAFLLRYGKYIFISNETLLKMEAFFRKYGAISTFTGRLIPGIRQLISIPAGLSKMDLRIFSLYTALGAGIWSLILIILGYILGDNQELIKSYLHQITLTLVVVIVLILIFYFYKNMNKKRL